MFKRLMLAAVAGFAILAAASCGSGGGNVTGNNPLNPTSAPSGVVASASPSPVSMATTPGTTPVTATPTATATAMSTGIVPTATPTAAPTPTATATSTGSSTACTTSTATEASMSYALNGSAETITLPAYNVYTGTSMVPSQGDTNTTLTVKTSQNNFDNAPTTTTSDPGYAARTKDFYSTIELSGGAAAGTSFGNGTDTQKIPITLNSPCIMAGVTYYVDLFALGSYQYSESDVATTNSVTGNIEVTVNPFPSGVTADVVLSH